MPGTALIVGAGIGGLSAAIALRSAGWNIRVFEQAISPRELGFGVALAPNAIAALDELGVGGTVVRRAFQPTRGEFRRMDGTVIKRAEMPPGFVGGPMVVALRPALHGALLEAVGPEPLSLGARVTGFTVTNHRVAITLSNGATAEGELLIGADGVRSVIRRTLHPTEGPPRNSGLVSVRGALHDALQHLGNVHAVYYMGPGVESMFVRASDTGIYWFLSMAKKVAPTGTDPAAIVRAMGPQFDDTFRAITVATEDMRFDELFDRDPLPSWGSGPVTLLGDAAHPMLPHTGQGAAQAIVDAVALAQSLTNCANLEASLREYERERLPKTSVLVGQGRRTARLMGTTNSIVCGIRELVLRAVPVRTFARFFVRVNRKAGTDIMSR